MSNGEKHPESKNSRALHLFESAIKSEATKVQYKLIVSKFLDWARVDDVDNFIAQDQKKHTYRETLGKLVVHFQLKQEEWD